jgi:hypothetical protein
MASESCGACVYYLAHSGGGRGDCRRFPPNVFSESAERSIFPVVEASMWCGEYNDSLQAVSGGTIWHDSTTLGLSPGQLPADSIGSDGDYFIDFNLGATQGRVVKKAGGTWAS